MVFFFFFQLIFFKCSAKKSLNSKKTEQQVKNKKMPDFASSAKFRQKVKNMLCLLNYNKNFVRTIDKA